MVKSAVQAAALVLVGLKEHLHSFAGRLSNEDEAAVLKFVAVALANKMARIIWALLVKGGRYQENGARNQMAAA